MGIDSFHERDKEEVLSDPHSAIVGKPTDDESLIIMYIFNTTDMEQGLNGLSGFHYIALKDSIKWMGLQPKKYVPILQGCMSNYLNGRSKKTGD